MRSLTLKLTLAFLFVGLIGALLVALFVGQRTQNEFGKFTLSRYQEDIITNLARVYEEQGNWDNIEAIVLQTPYRGRGREFVRAPLTLADADGVVVYGVGRYGAGDRLRDQDLRKAAPIIVDGETVGHLLFNSAAFPPNPPRETPESLFIRSVNQAILFSAIGATLIALVLGFFLARRITRPVKELTAATEAVAQGELGRQVEVRNRDEIGELAASFNQMSADLARGTELRRQMTADIAHDLRTPLSVILGYTEALADGKLAGTPEMFGVMHDESLHLQHLIDDLRTLSLADAGELSLTRQLCSPKALLERAEAAHIANAESRGVNLRIDAADDLLPIAVDPERMAQVFNNLISNALRFTPAGGDVILAAEMDEEAVYLRVQDTGEGIAAEDLPNIFERFYRSDNARYVQDGESGLGLAIVKSLTEAQGGKISAASEAGRGSVFTLTFPIASA